MPAVCRNRSAKTRLTAKKRNAKLKQVVYKNLRLSDSDARAAIARAISTSGSDKYIIILRPNDGKSNFQIRIMSDTPEIDLSKVKGFVVHSVKPVSQTGTIEERSLENLDRIVGTMVQQKQIPRRWIYLSNPAFEGSTPREYILKGNSTAVKKALEASKASVPL